MFLVSNSLRTLLIPPTPYKYLLQLSRIGSVVTLLYSRDSPSCLTTIKLPERASLGENVKKKQEPHIPRSAACRTAVNGLSVREAEYPPSRCLYKSFHSLPFHE